MFTVNEDKTKFKIEGAEFEKLKPFWEKATEDKKTFKEETDKLMEKQAAERQELLEKVQGLNDKFWNDVEEQTGIKQDEKHHWNFNADNADLGFFIVTKSKCDHKTPLDFLAKILKDIK